MSCNIYFVPPYLVSRDLASTIQFALATELDLTSYVVAADVVPVPLHHDREQTAVPNVSLGAVSNPQYRKELACFQNRETVHQVCHANTSPHLVSN